MIYKIFTFTLLISLALSPPTTSANSLDQALVAYAKHDIEKAVAILNELATNNDKQALMSLAKVQMRSGNAKEALKVTKRLIKKYPDDPDSHHAYGLANLTMMGQVGVFKFVSMAKRAKAGWDKAVELDPDHLDGLYALFSYYANAPKIGGGDIEMARRLQARMADIDMGYGHLAMGVLHAKAEQFEEAEAAFIETTKIMDTAGAYFALAQFYLGQGQFTQALDAISYFSTKPSDFWDPHPSAEYLVIAKAHAALGNIEAAKTAISTGLATKPGKRMRDFFDETLKEL